MELVFLCIKIFCCRIIDVSMGTIRTINVVKGKTLIGAVIGFFEVLIWFLIVKDALNTELTGILNKAILKWKIYGKFFVVIQIFLYSIKSKIFKAKEK